jgi:hypothetical protein
VESFFGVYCSMAGGILYSDLYEFAELLMAV